MKDFILCREVTVSAELLLYGRYPRISSSLEMRNEGIAAFEMTIEGLCQYIMEEELDDR